ncbi:MAG: response regulator [Bacteroidales bacterium]|nr:response regulator [Bacteroidales bacterium]
MVRETEKSYNNSGLNKHSEEFSDNLRKNIETYSIIALFCLVAAILLIMFNQRLLSGCMIFAGASIGLIIVRKVSDLNKRFKESSDEFSSLSEKKDEVINDFSHKIREPLNNLVIIVDMMMKLNPSEKQKELLETFIASTDNMVTTVNELTMESAGNLSYEYRKAIRFNLLSTIQNTIELYNLKDQANIDFILDKKEFNSFDCYGDPIIIKQIFLDLFNTIENQASEKAIKVVINLKKTKETATSNIISLRIQTDQTIFPVNSKDSEQSLSMRLISSRNGTFNQESGKDFTILNILLPFAKPLPETKQKIASPKIEALIHKEKTHKDPKELKILLVEDNIINQKITLLTLKPFFNNIDTASNGKEALDKFGTSNYDLILMDIQMPVMSGLVASEKIRALESSTSTHVPIIAITANAMIGDKEKCMSAGIDDYISKPFQPQALIDKITKNI